MSSTKLVFVNQMPFSGFWLSFVSLTNKMRLRLFWFSLFNIIMLTSIEVEILNIDKKILPGLDISEVKFFYLVNFLHVLRTMIIMYQYSIGPF